VLWLGVSLGAAAIVNISALLSVLLAVTGGIGLGWLLAKRFSTTTREVWSP
jgi:hypothetical protein